MPPDLAEWLLDLIEREAFTDPSEAVFVILREHSEVELHPDLREELLRRRMQAVIDHPALLDSGDDVRARHEYFAAQQRNPAVWDSEQARTEPPNLQHLIESGRQDQAIAVLKHGIRRVGAVGPRSAQAALKASVRLFAGDLEATIAFMNYRHPWLTGSTVMERAEQSDEGLEFVIDMIGAIEAGVHV
ncbi:MAG: DUF2384 domain-containing protein [Porphyrobacter sp.]|nr:DUF2384 domain-containing protein [Porphyrobacter sp.]